MDMQQQNKTSPQILPMIPLRGISVFPGMLLSFDIEREISLNAVDQALKENQLILLIAQKELSKENPSVIEDFYHTGTVCKVRQTLKMPGGGSKVLVEGLYRAYLAEIRKNKHYLRAVIEVVEEIKEKIKEVKSEALIRQFYTLFGEYADTTGLDADDLFATVLDSKDPGYIADYVAQNIYLRHEHKQMVLDEIHPLHRIALINRILRREIDIQKVENSIHESTAEQIASQQREMFLREQLKAIHAELGDNSDDADDIDSYRNKVMESNLPKFVSDKLNKEISRLAKQPFASAEAAVIRTYLDICLELPWTCSTENELDVDKAKMVLDADHYGLDKVKERILEYLAVCKLTKNTNGNILCLVGPPGTGKTSIAISISKALNRKMARISLGGIHDEAEIRGHRKTYVGSMPGRIMNGIQQAGTKNPVLLLDEIDKLGSDYKGDPSSALLEALDPEQNKEFRDHFVELPFDLSQVFFITTANTTETIPHALLDRMEVIELSAYTDEEKMAIAKQYLIPKQKNIHGLKSSQIRISDKALRLVISSYTREAGVRILERQIATLCRKAATSVVKENKGISVNEKNIESFLGPQIYHQNVQNTGKAVGLVHGLAWTQMGGELLDAEVGIMDGNGKLEITGNLGDVMKESCKAAVSYIRAHAKELNVPKDFYNTKDIHIHFPEGAIPKDGPSAGVTICTALVSALTGKGVKQNWAMTGEITLRGRVMAIGGLREKTMAALRNGITNVIIPKENKADLEKIDPLVRNKLHFVFAEQIDTVLETVIGN